MDNVHDYIIVGAGPGGLQMGYFMEKSGEDYLILDAAVNACSFFEQYPRHRKLLSINKVCTGHDDPELNFRYDWNSLICDDEAMLFKNYSKRFFPAADDLVRYMKDFAEHYNLKIRFNTKVTMVTKKDGIFTLDDQNGNQLRCRNLLVGTGVAKEYIPTDIPGVEHAEPYSVMNLNPDDYYNQRVLVIGKGNSAFEIADSLIETTASIHLTSPEPLQLAWKSHHVGHLRAVNNNFLDTYLLKSQNGLLEARISQIERLENGKFRVNFNLTRAHGATCQYDYDKVILSTGFLFDNSWFHEDCRPQLSYGRFPTMTSEWESTNTENMYFIGTVMQMRDFKRTQSSFIHGFRYNIRSLHKILRLKNVGEAWPSLKLDYSVAAIREKILDRLNRSSALWHQPKFFCDVFVVAKDRKTVAYYDELSYDYLLDSSFSKEEDYFKISLEYGPDHPDFPFEFDRHAEADKAELNPQLHPIIRRYRGSEMLAEHHVLEELEGSWVDDIFVQPLHDFLTEQLEPVTA